MHSYLISADIEGITGVCTNEFTFHGGKSYELGKRYMAHDINAVAEGILAADSAADITVRDAHGSATNVDLEKLHPKVKLLQGWGNLINMVAPAGENFCGVYFVGYHAGGHALNAVLSHTFCGAIRKFEVNGKIFNEAGINAIEASRYNIPVAFVSGDDIVCHETQSVLEGAVYITVKQSFARDSTISLPLAKSKELLFKGAKEATEKLQANKIAPFKLHTPAEIKIALRDRVGKACIYAPVEALLRFDAAYSFNKDDLTLTYKAASPEDFMNKFNLITHIIYGLSAMNH